MDGTDMAFSLPLHYLRQQRKEYQRQQANNATVAPHFASKHQVEKCIISEVATSHHQMRWTILRPMDFYEDLSADYRGKGFASMWK